MSTTFRTSLLPAGGRNSHVIDIQQGLQRNGVGALTAHRSPRVLNQIGEVMPLVDQSVRSRACGEKGKTGMRRRLLSAILAVVLPDDGGPGTWHADLTVPDRASGTRGDRHSLAELAVSSWQIVRTCIATSAAITVLALANLSDPWVASVQGSHDER